MSHHSELIEQDIEAYLEQHQSKDLLRFVAVGSVDDGKSTLIEAMINQELGEPFRRDAMKKPVAVAGIDRADMRPQKGA